MTRLVPDQHATVVREPDARRLKAMMGVLGLTGVLVVAVLGYVSVRLHVIRASYELDDLRSLQTELTEHNRKLRLERASLRAFARVDAAARRLGFTAPARDQVLLAREFTPQEPVAAGVAPIRTASTGLAEAGPATPVRR